MLADDLLGRITLDALPADIPAGDDPGGIQHVERVVGNAFDQKPETAFAFEQIPLALLVFFEHPGPDLNWPKRTAYGFVPPAKVLFEPK